jgi:osmoprotectant transport system ATP-binding protein
MIKVKNVSKQLAGKKILDSIDLSLAESQTHVLLGASGSGKSTLLRALAGLIAIDSGEIYLNGNRIDPDHQAQLARQIGYVIQEGGLFPHLTAAQNVTLVAHSLKWPKERIQKRFLELCTLVELDATTLERYPIQLSGGQRQRVGIMRASFLDPEIMLLDEPLGALDPIVRASLRSELKTIFNRLKKTVVIVTHDMAEAAFFGHTITLLHEGRVLQHGPFGELRDHPRAPYVKDFITAQISIMSEMQK